MDVSNILNPLNPAQREAVTSEAAHLLVLAGAGSGKTRVLVHRIAWQITANGLGPGEVMAVTFTNKAAGEMRNRIEEMLEYPSRGLWVGTFHGLAHRLLRQHWQEAKLPENFQILDSDDQLRLVKRTMKALQLDESHWPPRQAVSFINARKDEGLRPQHIETRGDLFANTMLKVYGAYEEACQRGGMLDFAELLLRAHELWRDNPELLAHYRRRFRHVLVDEFQDTNTIQYAWLRLLVGDEIELTVVGDDDQSIYGWRGARIEHIQQFTRDYPGVATVRLEQNYRSTGTILKAANGLISNNSNRLGKELWTGDSEGDAISLYAGFNEVDEARFVVNEIQRWREDNGSYREVAILYRSNAQSRVLEEALLVAGVPYRIYGGQRFFERLEIRNALAYLRLCRSRDDDAAFERVVNVPTRGIGERTVQAVREQARADQCSLWRAAQALVEHKGLPARAAGALGAFLALIDRLEAEGRGRPLQDLVEMVNRESGLLDFHGKEKGERGQARIENLQELVTAARQFWSEDEQEDEDSDRAALGAFLDHAALEAGEQQANEFEDCVQMMTLHSAKGLEFPLVFMTGMEEGLFPHQMSMDEPGRLEEERRLAYVGITRAMRRLYLTYAENRRLHGSEQWHTVSRFVREVPPELLEEIRLGTRISTPVSVPRFEPACDEPLPFQLGSEVSHAKFGRGTVLSCEGGGAQARVQINFEEAGIKWLMLSYAKLDPVS